MKLDLSYDSHTGLFQVHQDGELVRSELATEYEMTWSRGSASMRVSHPEIQRQLSMRNW